MSLAVLMKLHIRMGICCLEHKPRCGLADDNQFGVFTTGTPVFTTNDEAGGTYFLHIGYTMDITYN